MPAAADDVTPPTSAVLEECLDRLAALSAHDVLPAVFFREFLETILSAIAVENVTVWLRSGGDEWMHLALARSGGESHATSERVTQPPQWVRDALAGTMRITADEPGTKRLAGPVRQAGEVTGLLAFRFAAMTRDDELARLVPFAAAAAELAGEFLAARELRTLRQDRWERQHFERWQRDLADATSLEQLARIIAHDGRALSHADRLTVLRITGNGARVIAVSGVDMIDPRSPVVLALEALAAAAQHEPSPVPLPSMAQHGPLLEAWNQLASLGGTHSAVIGCVRDRDREPLGVLVAERFSEPRDDHGRAQLADVVSSATPWWRLLAAEDRPWWSQLFVTQSQRRRSRSWIAALTALLLVGLAAIPIPFRIPAEGELAPVHRRDLFATANGMVESVLVEHGDRVTAGQVLARLRDPNVDMEATRITGELATARARLEVVEAARIAGSANAGETPARLQQLASEAADLRQQCDALVAQQKLLDAERETWTIRSPLNGEVLTWDVQSLLSGRPIERGQVLLTVGETTGDWEVHARVRERDFAHLPQLQDGSIGDRADVILAGISQVGRVTRVSRVTDLNDRGESTIRLTVALDQPRLTHARAGRRVWLRLDCGRQPLAYVWFHDFVDALRTAIWLRR